MVYGEVIPFFDRESSLTAVPGSYVGESTVIDSSAIDSSSIGSPALGSPALGSSLDTPFLLAKSPQITETVIPAPEFDETDFSSIDSFSLTDSPDGTTISTPSHRSSRSSLSAINFKTSPRANLSANSKRLDRRRDLSRSGSSLFSSSDSSPRSEYVALKNECTKFGSRPNAIKANHLRLTLLPFLRQNLPREQLATPEADLDLPLRVFGMWWTQVLDVIVKDNFRNVSGVDRNLFYEVISSLMARPEWVGHRDKPRYQYLLNQTLTHCLTRCATSPNVNVSQSAFAGKVLAYAFFFLPGFAMYLLSLMGASQRSVKRLVKNCTLETVFPASATMCHLRPLVNAHGVPKEDSTGYKWLQKGLYNGWETHFRMDTPIFASFFKHFCSLQSQYLPKDNNQFDDFPLEDPESMEEGRLASFKARLSATKVSESMIMTSPGMFLVLAYILDGLSAVLSTRASRSRNNSSALGRRRTSIGMDSNPAFATNTERIRVDKLKIFSAFREVLHSDDSTSPHFLVYCRIFDQVFQDMAKDIRMHDMEGCVMVCNVAEEWLSSAFAVRATKVQEIITIYKQISVDWNFWLKVVEKMLQSDNFHTEIRALSFLFNVWPQLPNDESVLDDAHSSGEHSKERMSILRRTTKWIISPEMWFQLFCHWSPLVRSYYHRLLCYRLASVGVGTKSWYLDVDSAQDLEESRALLREALLCTYDWCATLSQKTEIKSELSPSMPLPRLRVSIRHFGPFPPTSPDKMESSLARSFPFDIFDTAAYWKSSQETTNGIEAPQQTVTRSGAGDLCRSASRVSKASVESVSSVRSNTSIASNFSVTTVKSHMKRLSGKFGSSVNLAGKLADTTTDSGKPSSDSASTTNNKASSKEGSNGKKENKTISTRTRFPFWYKLFPGKSSSLECQEEPVCANKTVVRPPERKPSESKSEKASINEKTLPSPAELTQPRPEIVRPAYRFIMVPTNSRPSPRTTLAKPVMPFSQQLASRSNSFNAHVRDVSRDLAFWNYGGRSLAEWNIEVTCFERFAQQQQMTAGDNMEMFAMPFLVAEIPWRMVG